MNRLHTYIYIFFKIIKIKKDLSTANICHKDETILCNFLSKEKKKIKLFWLLTVTKHINICLRSGWKNWMQVKESDVKAD